jgi:hypothetical protein
MDIWSAMCGYEHLHGPKALPLRRGLAIAGIGACIGMVDSSFAESFTDFGDLLKILGKQPKYPN